MHTCKFARIFSKCFEVWCIIIYDLMTCLSNDIVSAEDPKVKSAHLKSIEFIVKDKDWRKKTRSLTNEYIN